MKFVLLILLVLVTPVVAQIQSPATVESVPPVLITDEVSCLHGYVKTASGKECLETTGPIFGTPLEAATVDIVEPIKLNPDTVQEAKLTLPVLAVPGTPATVVVVDIKTAAPGVIELGTAAVSSEEAQATVPDVAVRTTEGIVVDDNKLFVETASGQVELAVLPHEVPALASSVQEITGAELKVVEDAPVYEVTGTTQAKLFGIIPITADVVETVSAESGEVVSVDKPLWGIIATGI